MKIGEWIIPEEYGSEDHLGDGRWEGDCVYVLAWDKQNERIYCHTSHAYAYTKRVSRSKPTIVTGSSGYYNTIVEEMVPFDDGYTFEPDPEEMYRDFVEYLFKILAWNAILR